MIYRMKKWDLPKGKKESGEKHRQTAVREVEEECGVKVKIGKKLCTTWHTYTMNKRAMLKTRWYVMDLTDDSKIKPSLEEDIEEIRWMTQKKFTTHLRTPTTRFDLCLKNITKLRRQGNSLSA